MVKSAEHGGARGRAPARRHACLPDEQLVGLVDADDLEALAESYDRFATAAYGLAKASALRWNRR